MNDRFYTYLIIILLLCILCWPLAVGAAILFMIKEMK